MLPSKYCCVLSKSYASKENVENVVNPPHTPVFVNNIKLGDTLSLAHTIPAINPIAIAPMRFVMRVNTGNTLFIGIRLIAYRPIAPKAPPNATHKKDIYATSINPDLSLCVRSEHLCTFCTPNTTQPPKALLHNGFGQLIPLTFKKKQAKRGQGVFPVPSGFISLKSRQPLFCPASGRRPSSGF